MKKRNIDILRNPEQWDGFIERSRIYEILARNADILFKTDYEIDWFIDTIKHISDADIVKVTRCKDCVWWCKKGFDLILNHHHGCCERPLGEYYECDQEFSTEENDYCSYGERRENGKS